MAFIGGREIKSGDVMRQEAGWAERKGYDPAQERRQEMGLARSQQEAQRKQVMADEANTRAYQSQVEYAASGVDYDQARTKGIYNAIDEAMKNPQSQVARFEQDGSLSIASPEGQPTRMSKMEVDAYVLAHKKYAPQYNKTLQDVMTAKGQGLAIELTEGQKPPNGFEDIVKIGGKAYAMKTKGAQSADYQIAKEEEVMQKRNSIATANANAEVERIATQYGDGQLYTKAQVDAKRKTLSPDMKFESIQGANKFALVPKDLNLEFAVKGREEKPEKLEKNIVGSPYKPSPDGDTILESAMDMGIIKENPYDTDYKNTPLYTEAGQEVIKQYNRLAKQPENKGKSVNEILTQMGGKSAGAPKQEIPPVLANLPPDKVAGLVDFIKKMPEGKDKDAAMKKITPLINLPKGVAKTEIAPDVKTQPTETPVKVPETEKLKSPERKEIIPTAKKNSIEKTKATRITDTITFMSKKERDTLLQPVPGYTLHKIFTEPPLPFDDTLTKAQKEFAQSSDNAQRAELARRIIALKAYYKKPSRSTMDIEKIPQKLKEAVGD